MSEERTLRDEFAMLAMQGIVSGCGNAEGFVNYNDTVLAMNAYKLADAMMMARNIDIQNLIGEAQNSQEENNESAKQAELILADEREACAKQYLGIMRNAVEEAVKREREACAKLCDELDNNQTNQSLLELSDCAEAIRARSKHD